MKYILVFVILKTLINQSFEIKLINEKNPTAVPRKVVSDWRIQNLNPLDVNRTSIKDVNGIIKAANENIKDLTGENLWKRIHFYIL